MISLLTKLAVGTVALFIVGVVVAAVSLTSGQDTSAAKRASVGKSGASQANIVGTNKKTRAVHRSSLALVKTEDVENINYFGSRLSQANGHLKPARSSNTTEMNTIQFVER